MEVWKDIVGFEGCYWVSNKGRVSFIMGSFGRRTLPTHAAGRRERATLIKDGKRKTFYVHRLVAEAFLEKPAGDYVVNHKDEDKLNNSHDNLEWVSHRYNVIYSAIKLLSEAELEKLKWLLLDNNSH